MIERVTAALIRFVQPLAAAITSDTGNKAHDTPDFERFKAKKLQNAEASSLSKKLAEKAGNQSQAQATDVNPENQQLPRRSPRLEVVSSEKSQKNRQPDLVPENGPQSSQKPSGSTQAFLDILALLQSQSNQRYRAVGLKTYLTASTKQTKAGKLKKGSILNQNQD